MKKWLLALSFFLPVVFAAPPKQQFILTQKDAPATLAAFTWNYVQRERGVIAGVNYRNMTNQEISALSICFIFYGAFNNELSTRCGLDMFTSTDGNLKPGFVDNGEWLFGFSGDWQTTTAIAFVSRVRTLDNKIWQFDEKEISEQIRKLIGAGFDPSKITNP